MILVFFPAPYQWLNYSFMPAVVVVVEVVVVVVRWMYGMNLKNRISGKVLIEHMGIVCFADVMGQVRLRWFGRGKDGFCLLV